MSDQTEITPREAKQDMGRLSSYLRPEHDLTPEEAKRFREINESAAVLDAMLGASRRGKIVRPR